MKVAIVHDYLNQYGGAEKTVEVLHELYPEAPIFTSIFLPGRLPPLFSTMDIRPSFMQKLPFLGRHFKKYLLLYPSAIERFDLKGFDLILSSSSAFAKGVRRPAGACHVSYCYSPMRFAWDLKSYIDKEEFNLLYRWLLPSAVCHLKKWDIGTLDRVDHFIAISRHISRKIKATYQRDAEVIYPPVNLSEFFVSETPDDYFLIVSRLNAYKRIDVAIDTFNQLSLPLLIIGKGPFEKALKEKANKNIHFLGEVSQAELPSYLNRCRAFIFPGEEDFGIAPVEAMASGRPIIAYGKGGALETVSDGVTGLFFRDQTAPSLMEAIHRFMRLEFNSTKIRKHAEQFDKEVFKQKIGAYVAEKVQKCRAAS
jgi:glycosyltransferase involved in cell wall biosynthesis